MKLLISCALLLTLALETKSQKQQKEFSVALMNVQAAMPFGKFVGLFTDQLHPGIEGGVGKNFAIKQHHEWFARLKVAYFYHRFVQHATPLYVDFGYRYKFSNHFSAETSIGAGYMHSIPATSQLKLNGDGNYVKHKGLGRMQAMTSYSIGLGYIPNPSSPRPIRIFTAYRQQIQMPFIKSYVPLLPYNGFLVGIGTPIR